MKTRKIQENKFKSYQAEADYWDKHDTADEMKNDGAWFTFDVELRDERCSHCGSPMRIQTADLHLLGNRLTLHRVKLFVCPTCRNIQMPREVEDFSRVIEVTAMKAGLVKQAI